MARVTPLKLAILEAGISQRELAERIEVSESRMSFIVRGLHVDDDTKAKIAHALGRQVDELWIPAERAA